MPRSLRIEGRATPTIETSRASRKRAPQRVRRTAHARLSSRVEPASTRVELGGRHCCPLLWERVLAGGTGGRRADPAIVRSAPYLYTSMDVKQCFPERTMSAQMTDQADLAEVDVVTRAPGAVGPGAAGDRAPARGLWGRAGRCPAGRSSSRSTKSTASHHLKALRCAGVIAQRDEGTRRYTWLRRDELEERFPGLLEAVAQGLRHGVSGTAATTSPGEAAPVRVVIVGGGWPACVLPGPCSTATWSRCVLERLPDGPAESRGRSCCPFRPSTRSPTSARWTRSARGAATSRRAADGTPGGHRGGPAGAGGGDLPRRPVQHEQEVVELLRDGGRVVGARVRGPEGARGDRLRPAGRRGRHPLAGADDGRHRGRGAPSPGATPPSAAPCSARTLPMAYQSDGRQVGLIGSSEGTAGWWQIDRRRPRGRPGARRGGLSGAGSRACCPRRHRRSPGSPPSTSSCTAR